MEMAIKNLCVLLSPKIAYIQKAKYTNKTLWCCYRTISKGIKLTIRRKPDNINCSGMSIQCWEKFDRCNIFVLYSRTRLWKFYLPQLQCNNFNSY